MEEFEEMEGNGATNLIMGIVKSKPSFPVATTCILYNAVYLMQNCIWNSLYCPLKLSQDILHSFFQPFSSPYF